MLVAAVVAVAIAGVACIAYGVLIERHWYRLVRRRLDILPASAPRPITLLHLSDLHVVRGSDRLRAFVASLPRADVTAVTGDIVGEPEAVEEAVDILRAVRGRIASYFVLGSNDYYVPRPLNPARYFVGGTRRRRRAQSGRGRELAEMLAADGWIDLDNVRTTVELDGLPVEVFGLDDPHIDRQDLRVAIRREPDRFGLGVIHSPDPMPEIASLGWDLVVYGHTHGGQVRLPFVGALVTNSYVPRRLVSGLVRLGSSIANVSPGLGTSKYAPFRFLCRPAADLLELGPRSATPDRSSAPAERSRRIPAR